MAKKGPQPGTMSEEARRRIGEAASRRQVLGNKLMRGFAPLLEDKKFNAILNPDAFLQSEQSPAFLKQVVEFLRPELAEIKESFDRLIVEHKELCQKLDDFEAKHPEAFDESPTEQDFLRELSRSQLPALRIFRATQSPERRTAEKELKETEDNGQRKKRLQDFWENWESGRPPQIKL